MFFTFNYPVSGVYQSISLQIVQPIVGYSVLIILELELELELEAEEHVLNKLIAVQPNSSADKTWPLVLLF